MTSRRPFVALLAAETISGAGTRMSQLAVPWLVLTTTHSPVSTGIVAAAEIAPYVVLQILGGPMVDRLGGHRVAVLGNVVAGAGMFAIPIGWDAGLHRLAPILALVFVAGLARGPADSATQVLLPAVTERAGLSIERSSALFDGAGRTANLVGAPLGAILITAMGAANVVLLDALSFLAAAVLIGLLVPVAAGHTRVAEDEVRSYLDQLRTGLRYVARHRLLRNIAGMVFFTNLADAAMSGLLLLLWVRDNYGGARRVGLLGACFSIGAVAGTVVIATYASRVPRRLTFAGAFLLAGPPRFLILALPAPFWAVVITFSISGLSAGAINPVLSAAEYDAVPRELQARVLGAVGALAWAGMPFGALLAGALVDATTLTTALAVGAGLYLTVTLDPFVRRSWSALDRQAPPLPAAITVPERD